MPNEEGLLQPHELAERGMGPAVFGPVPLETTEGVQIVDFNMNRTRFGPGNVYTAEEDITETLPDGRQIQVATNGTEMPLSEAVRLGLVKVDVTATPQETKVDEPAETKAGTTAAEEAPAEEADAPAEPPAPAPKTSTAKAEAKK